MGRCFLVDRGQPWIDIYIPEDMRFPRKMPDAYVQEMEALRHFKEYPRIVNNIQEFIGYVFLHELRHIIQAPSAAREADASAWANIRWLPY